MNRHLIGWGQLFVETDRLSPGALVQLQKAYFLIMITNNFRASSLFSLHTLHPNHFLTFPQQCKPETRCGRYRKTFQAGVGLAFINVNIWIAAGLIGLATTFMVTLGVMVGRVVSSVLGHRTEIFAGFTLIDVGVWILSSHL
jgi:hypothetical protein